MYNNCYKALIYRHAKCYISLYNVKKLITNSSMMTKTAGIIIIGDEILKGQTQDTNSYHICKALHEVGVEVKQISVIGDDVELISSEIKKFSSSFDFVLTSGGIGPTHDDLTLDGIALAFQEELLPHPTLVELCSKYFGPKDLSSPEMKLAMVPSSAALHFAVDKVKGETFKFPLISVKNVFVFPGIPVLLRRLIDNLSHLFGGDGTFHSETLLINALETEIATILTNCSKKFKDAGISIGSYPDWFNNYYKVKVIIESANKDATFAAANYLKQTLPKKYLIDNFVSDPVSLSGSDVFGDVIKTKFPLLQQKIFHSTSILEDALKRYPNNSICIGFNGGKDCTALLHLFHAVVCRSEPKIELQALYIKDEYPFEELESFMTETVQRYNLDLITLKGDMKTALNQLRIEKPFIEAVVMGTRCTDPYSRNLTSFTSTDSDWPKFMRVNPILNWTYHDIWMFLRTLCLPYCVLYDRGYTSLGSREKTYRNEKLIVTGKNGRTIYAPAYTLQNEDLERNGRL